jgi:type II secretory pathway pseudopilin PulG
MARSRPALTLLEAILALAILAMVAAAVLEMRGAAIRESARIQKIQRDTREVEAIFRMLTERALPQPIPDPATGAPVWQGQHLGEPFAITRRTTTVPNPALQATDMPLADRLPIFEYLIDYRGTKTTFLWHR